MLALTKVAASGSHLLTTTPSLGRLPPGYGRVAGPPGWIQYWMVERRSPASLHLPYTIGNPLACAIYTDGSADHYQPERTQSGLALTLSSSGVLPAT
jgi:hypothetical protein